MKKLIATFTALFALMVSAFAGTITTNSQGQIIYTYTNAMGYEVSAVIGEVGSSTVPAKIPSAEALVIGTAAPTATPDQIGQFALDRGQAAYVAVGGTSSDWKAIPTFTLSTGTNVAMTGVTPDAAGALYYSANGLVVGTSTGKVALATTATTNGWVLLDLYD